MPQEFALFPQFTINETMKYFGRVYHMSDKAIEERSNYLLDLLQLPSKRRKITNLSGGQQRRVSLAAALIHRPPLLILDEPTVGTDPLLRQGIWDYLNSLCKNDGLTVIITTHYIEEARRAATVGIMRFGRLLAEENPDTLLQQYDASSLESVFLKLCEVDTLPTNCIAKTEMVSQLSEKTRQSICNNPIPPVETKPINPIARFFEGFDRRRIVALFIKNVINLTRNIPILLFYCFLPTSQVALFFLCFGSFPRDIPVGVFNEENPPDLSAKLLQSFSNDTIIQIPYNSLNQSIQDVRDGKIRTVFHFPPNYTEAFEMRSQDFAIDNSTVDMSNVRMYIDLSDQVIGVTIVRELFFAFQKFAYDFLIETGFNPGAISSPLVVDKVIHGTLNPSVTEFFTPGIIVLVAYYGTTALTALSLVLERKDGLLERSVVAGVTSQEYLLSHILTHVIVLIIQQILMITYCISIYQITFKGALIDVILLAFCQGIGGMMFGLLISSISGDEITAAILGAGFFLPSLLLGGVLWPIESMSSVTKQISQFLPQTIPVNSMRFILNRGWNLAYMPVLEGFLVTGSWTLLFLTCAYFIFKRNIG